MPRGAACATGESARDARQFPRDRPAAIRPADVGGARDGEARDGRHQAAGKRSIEAVRRGLGDGQVGPACHWAARRGGPRTTVSEYTPQSPTQEEFRVLAKAVEKVLNG